MPTCDIVNNTVFANNGSICKSISDIRREKYFLNMQNDRVWADDLIIYAASIALKEQGFDLQIFYKGTNPGESKCLKFSDEKSNKKIQIYHNGSHYDGGSNGQYKSDGDGNCFFHSLYSELKRNLGANEIFDKNGRKVDHKYLRSEACEFLNDSSKVTDDYIDAMYVANNSSSGNDSESSTNKFSHEPVSDYSKAVIIARGSRSHMSFRDIIQEQQEILNSFPKI